MTIIYQEDGAKTPEPESKRGSPVTHEDLLGLRERSLDSDREFLSLQKELHELRQMMGEKVDNVTAAVGEMSKSLRGILPGRGEVFFGKIGPAGIWAVIVALTLLGLVGQDVWRDVRSLNDFAAAGGRATSADLQRTNRTVLGIAECVELRFKERKVGLDVGTPLGDADRTQRDLIDDCIADLAGLISGLKAAELELEQR